MADLSAQSAGRGIAPRGHLEDMFFEFLLKRFFGVIPGSERLKRLRELYRTIDIRNPSGAIRSQALAALDAISGSVIESCRSMNNSNGPRPLFAAIQDCGLDSERERVVLSNFIYIAQNARNDTAGLLVWVLKMLGDNPPWQARLIESARTPAKSADCGDLAKRIISETLRLEQSEFLYRNALADLECEGFVIPRGWLVRLCVRESHRDASIFDQPDKFDPDRFRDRSYSRTEYSPFGLTTSRHLCLGEQITRRVGRVFLKELASGYDWKVAHHGRREFDGWHWTPGSRFRVHLTRRESR